MLSVLTPCVSNKILNFEDKRICQHLRGTLLARRLSAEPAAAAAAIRRVPAAANALKGAARGSRSSGCEKRC